MNLDINVDENDWSTLPIPNTLSFKSLKDTFTPAPTHPLQPAVIKENLPKKVIEQAKVKEVAPPPPINPEDDPLRALLSDPLGLLIGNNNNNNTDADKNNNKSDDIALAADSTPSSSNPEDNNDMANAVERLIKETDPIDIEDPRELLLTKLQRRFEFWNQKEPQILEKYTTSVNIAVDNTFLNDSVGSKNSSNDPMDELEHAAMMAATAGSAKNKKMRRDQATGRLEEIQYETGTAVGGSNSKQAKSYLSQKDFIKHIEEQHTKMMAAWSKGERVMALRVVIQCAKLLGDMSIPQFYPSMFVILTRVLSTFGELVFNRLRERGIESIDPYTKQIITQPLSASFKASDVCASAKDTCRNWFYKTTCIRELLPRLYIDMALIKCYRFLEDEDLFAENLQRVCMQIRGVGDPLTASYLRSYIATKALDITYSFHEKLPPPQQRYHITNHIYRDSVRQALSDWLIQHAHLKATQCASVPIVKQGVITAQQYFDLMAPSIEWIIQVLYYTENNPKEFTRFILNNNNTESSTETTTTTTSPIVKNHDDLIILNAIVNGFRSEFVVKYLDELLEIVRRILDPLRDKYATYEEIIQEELDASAKALESDNDSDNDDDSDGETNNKKKSKKNNKQNTKIPPPAKATIAATTNKKQSLITSHTQNSKEYQEFSVLHKYVEEYATKFYALICKKLIMYSQLQEQQEKEIAASLNSTSSSGNNNNTHSLVALAASQQKQLKKITMTSSLLNSLWSGICDCPYKDFVNVHSPSLALLICIHGRWNDQQVLLKNALKTLKSQSLSSSKNNNPIVDNNNESNNNNEEDLIEYNNTIMSIENIFTLSQHLIPLLTNDNVLTILDQLQRPQRIFLANILLRRYKQWILQQQKEKLSWQTADTMLIHTLHELCVHIHSSINSLTERHVINTIADLCSYVVLSINYGNDVEQQLSTYVSFRANLTELPSILKLLIYQTNKLCLYALKMVSLKTKQTRVEQKDNDYSAAFMAISTSSAHTRKTSSFVKAAIAFCHITIPSLPHSNNDDIYQRIELFLTTSQTSIINGLLPQAEALITAAIQQLTLLSNEIKVDKDNTNNYKYLTIHELSQQVTNMVSCILTMLCKLPPIGGQWLRLLGIILNIIEKKTCPCIDLISAPLIYTQSLYVIAVMTQKQQSILIGTGINNNNSSSSTTTTSSSTTTISEEEKQAMNVAKTMIINKLLWGAKILFITGGGTVLNLTKDENTEIQTLLTTLNAKYPPQLICDTLTIITQQFFNVMRIDPYVATIIFALITGIKEIIKSHQFSISTIEYFIQYAKDITEYSNSNDNNSRIQYTPKEIKLYNGLAKRLTEFLGK